MLLLLPGNARQIKRHLSKEQIGWLITPKHQQRIDGFRWAADNECFSQGEQFDIDRYVRFLSRLQEHSSTCLFVTAPDVVSNSYATAERWVGYSPTLKEIGLPIAYVAQDGMNELPRVDFDTLFIGGSTEYKLSSTVRKLIAEAKRAGKWVHMGRVNTIVRFWYAFKVGADSIDGTAFLRPDRHLPWALRELGAMHRQLSF